MLCNIYFLPLWSISQGFIIETRTMKKKRLHTDPIEVRRELQKVAYELGSPLNDCRLI